MRDYAFRCVPVQPVYENGHERPRLGERGGPRRQRYLDVAPEPSPFVSDADEPDVEPVPSDFFSWPGA